LLIGVIPLALVKDFVCRNSGSSKKSTGKS
jgi:hypothetical protein